MKQTPCRARRLRCRSCRRPRRQDGLPNRLARARRGLTPAGPSSLLNRSDSRHFTPSLCPHRARPAPAHPGVSHDTGRAAVERQLETNAVPGPAVAVSELSTATAASRPGTRRPRIRRDYSNLHHEPAMAAAATSESGPVIRPARRYGSASASQVPSHQSDSDPLGAALTDQVGIRRY